MTLIMKSAPFAAETKIDGSETEIWRIAILVLAIMPAFHMVATWDADGNLTWYAHILRVFSLPVILLEIFLLIFSYVKGWRPWEQFKSIPKIIQIAAYIFLGVGFVSSIQSGNLLVLSLLNFFKWHSLITLGACAYVALMVLFCLIIPNPDTFRWVERIPSATNIRQIGNVIGILAIVPVVLLYTVRERIYWPFIVAANITLLAFLMWSGTRGGLVGYFIAIAMISLFAWKLLNRRIITTMLLSWLASVGIALAMPIPAEGFGLIRVQESMKAEDVTSGRLVVWNSTIEAIKDAPLIGHGSGTFRANMSRTKGYHYNHPHNFILQFIYDWGFLGGGMAAIFVMLFGLKLLLLPSATIVPKATAIGAFSAITSVALIDGTLFYPLPMIIALALIAPALAEKASRDNQLT
jgi:O-antigen ligase